MTENLPRNYLMTLALMSSVMMLMASTLPWQPKREISGVLVSTRMLINLMTRCDCVFSDTRVFVGESCLVSTLTQWGPLYEYYVRQIHTNTWIGGEDYYHGYERNNVALSQYSNQV